MTIPEDIRSAASRCIMKAAGNPRLDDIAEAIWEERQRCAAIVEADGDNATPPYMTLQKIMEPA